MQWGQRLKDTDLTNEELREREKERWGMIMQWRLQCVYKEGLISKDKNSGCLPAGAADTDKKNKKGVTCKSRYASFTLGGCY